MGTKFSTVFRCLTARRLLALSAALFFAVAAVAIGAFVAPTSVFQLNGIPDTSVSDPSGDVGKCNTPPNWVNLNGTTGNDGTALCGSGTHSFQAGSDPANATNFTSGGSKDGNDISSGGATSQVWAFTTTSSPAKDVLTNGYAADFVATTGGSAHKILVFGAERFANNGDSNIGIWFFQNSIGKTSGSKGSFTGLHAEGDILVVSAFTAGGGTSTISVYDWDPRECPNSNYPNITSSGYVGGSLLCAAQNIRALWFDITTASNSGDAAFATVNTQNVTVSWPYSEKFAGLAANTVPTGAFYEGGIDLTALFPTGQNVPCFSSFLMETRSSQSVNAVLKDFLLGGFGECKISATKACACTAFHSDTVAYDYVYGGHVTNNGGGTLYDVTVVDQGHTYACGTVQPQNPNQAGSGLIYFGADGQSGRPTGASVCSNTANTFTAAAGASNVALVCGHTANVGTACDPTKTFSGQVNGSTGSISCLTTGACTPSPALTVTKQCVTALEYKSGFVVVRVDYTGTVQNTGDVNVTGVTVTDRVAGASTDNASFSVGALTAGPNNAGQIKCYTNGADSCPTITPAPITVNPLPVAGTASYYPSVATNDVGNAGRAEFEDTVTATGTDVYNDPVPKVGGTPITATGKCVVCPFGYCAASGIN